MEYVIFDKEKNRIKDFILVSKNLYDKDTHCEDAKDMRKILLGEHPLSKYFELTKFLIYDGSKPVARFIITRYPDDSTAYFGFYECEDNDETAAYTFKVATDYAKEKGFDKIVGPVNASFWIGYRLKINLFSRKPYTGEPYNKDYYFKQFKDNGFAVSEHYTSQIYQSWPEGYSNEKFENRLAEFLDKGYVINSPSDETFDDVIKELYGLLTSLYSDFPIFKQLSEEDFCQTFHSYKSIINYSMVKMAYYEGKLVGFYISVPNYGNMVYRLNPANILKILKLRKHPKEYVMLYMGVDQNHRGLGKALVYSIMEELRLSGLPSIGALTRDGKLTQTYVDELVDDRFEYVLLEKGCRE